MTFARRTCGECTLCCKLPLIDWQTDPPVGRPPLNKPMNTLCQYCIEGKGCTIYPDRPLSCAGFQCMWLMGFMDDDMRPDKVGGFFDVQGPYLLLLKDPARPDPMSDPRVKGWADSFARARKRRFKVVRLEDPKQPRAKPTRPPR
jgi:hypothetical protein